jgi:Fe-S-cluster containining protein
MAEPPSKATNPAPSGSPAMAGSTAPSTNPCIGCGACCASFTVDFSEQELESQGGRVPEGLTVPVREGLCRMRGTDHAKPRCAALCGQVGRDARCGIYEWRPNPCREFGERAPFGVGDAACARARRAHGLDPL